MSLLSLLRACPRVSLRSAALHSSTRTALHSSARTLSQLSVPTPALCRLTRPRLALLPPRRGLASEPPVSLTFQFPDGERQTVAAKIGDSLLDVVLDHEVDIDGFGACEGTLACSTCHVILPEELFSGMEADITDEEMDMLDLAFGLEATSRLGCQCIVNKNYDGRVVMVPGAVNDQR